MNKTAPKEVGSSQAEATAPFYLCACLYDSQLCCILFSVFFNALISPSSL